MGAETRLNLDLLVDMCRIIVRAQHILQWSFVFLFFMKKGPSKDTFTFALGNLEDKGEHLLNSVKAIVRSSYTVRAFMAESSDGHRSRKKVSDEGKTLNWYTSVMIDRADEIIAEVAYDPDQRTDKWSCLRCTQIHQIRDKEKVCRSCTACRKHGEYECLDRFCKKKQSN